MLASLLVVVVLNLVIELTVAYLLAFRSKNELYAVGFVNLLTNPIVNYLAWTGVVSSFLSVSSLEICVILVEAGALRYALRNKFQKYLLLSIAMNLASFGIGWAIGILRYSI